VIFCFRDVTYPIDPASLIHSFIFLLFAGQCGHAKATCVYISPLWVQQTIKNEWMNKTSTISIGYVTSPKRSGH